MPDNRRRLVQRDNGAGGYFLAPMTDKEHKVFEAELGRPDFEQAHGLPADLFERAWLRQGGMCGVCSRPMDVQRSYYEEAEGSALVCEADSAVLTIRADSERFGIASPV